MMENSDFGENKSSDPSENTQNAGEIDSDNENIKKPPSLWFLATLGSTLVGCTVGGLIIGQVLDNVLKSYPVGTFTGTMLGIVLAVVTAWAQIKKFL